ncbi:MAG: glutamine-hydrolyzing GMP synthase [Desulfobacterales bacterium]
MILIIDFGSQYNQLIARRVREFHVYCQIDPPNVSIDYVKNLNPEGIILSGGPSSIYEKNSPKCDEMIFHLGIPVLGICYGMQFMINALGGSVEKSKKREYGFAELKVKVAEGLFKSINEKTKTWMSHGDSITKLPSGFKTTASTENTKIAATANALSGGVDSSVTALLLHKAVGKNLTCIFVDNGLLRKNEAKKLKKTFKQHLKINIRFVNAKTQFLTALTGITNPEKKRKIIGKIFMKVFEVEARKIKDAEFLAQGTLYPDIIESQSAFGGPTSVIKSHHNVGGLPKKMKLKLVEPLKYLFKDEVRLLGKALGLDEDLIWRQPFPGPGLAIRIIGEINAKRLLILRNVDDILLDEIKNSGYYRKLWQSFAVLLPIKSVGVMGDKRTYENIVAIRAVTSKDAMTADWAKLPHKLLGKISNRIINEVNGVNRVVYDISSKPPSTIEWD